MNFRKKRASAASFALAALLLAASGAPATAAGGPPARTAAAAYLANGAEVPAVSAEELAAVTPAPAEAETSAFELVGSKATKVARVTGATPAGESLPNPNRTDANYAVGGTDLGIVWDATTDPAHPKTMIAFGDTFDGWSGDGGGGTGWRGNVLALSGDRNLSDGLAFDSMIADPASPGYAKEIIHSDHDTSGGGDFTAIPTAGIAVGSRQFIHYMQIRAWGPAGTWSTNFSEIAYSDDDGQTWTKSGVKWEAGSKFAQAAFVRHDGYMYMFGTPAGRFGGAYLARVPEADMLTQDRYAYWNGSGWTVNDEASAAPVVEGPIGELSVAYNTYYDKFIMTYLNEDRAAVVLRSSSEPAQGWSGESEIATGTSYPALYGAFIHPWSLDGKDLYFLMSQWGPYNVFLMHTTLSKGSPAKNAVADPSFEQQTDGAVSAPWITDSGSGGIDRGLNNAREGANNAFVRSSTGWNGIKQDVAVAPDTEYELTAFIRTSQNNGAGYFGVRRPDGTILKEVQFGRFDGYTKQTVRFNSGDLASVTVFTGMWANGDTWAQMDDYSLLPVDAEPPVITLKGEPKMEVPLNGAFADPGATASDNADGDLTGRIAVEGSVDTSLTGTYTLTYKVTDDDGNAAVPVMRTVKVTGPSYGITNAVFKDENGKALSRLPQKGWITASAEVKSNTGNPVPVTIVLVLLDKKGNVANVSGVTHAIAPGAAETFSAGFRMPGNNSGYTAKLYVADSLTGLKPLSNIASLKQR